MGHDLNLILMINGGKLMKNQFEITGRVDCKCGDQILSNSGKASFVANKEGHISKLMKCWNPKCKGVYHGDDIYKARKDGEVVVFDDSTDIKVFRVGDDPFDWIAAKSQQEAMDYFNEYYDGEDYELDDYEEASLYQILVEEDDPNSQTTIRKTIEQTPVENFPCIIASTDF